jgi:hypothetical protein
MAEPAWLGYTGAITGIVGALTGIAGAAMGYVSYRRTEQLKTLDLRVELRKLLTDVHAVCTDLPDLIERADKSRKAVAAATGGHNSGAAAKWGTDLIGDQALLKSLRSKLPESNSTFAGASQTDLEERLLHFYALQGQAISLRDRYLSALAEDDRQRDHIRNDFRTRAQAQLGTGP